MNKLFYEARQSFKPNHYMVMMGDSQKGDWKPVNFGITSGRFGFGELNFDPSLKGEPVEIYDHETAMALMAHHALNSTATFDLRLVPVYIPESLTSPSESPYLNRAAPHTPIIDEIKAAAAYSQELLPDDEPEAWHMPASLGGSEVVPANTLNILSDALTTNA